MQGLEQFCLCQAWCLVLYSREMSKTKSLPSENLLWSLLEVLKLKVTVLVILILSIDVLLFYVYSGQHIMLNIRGNIKMVTSLVVIGTI